MSQGYKQPHPSNPPSQGAGNQTADDASTADAPESEGRSTGAAAEAGGNGKKKQDKQARDNSDAQDKPGSPGACCT
jgi:hypothetical protein